jgi:N-acetylneuraminate synthase
VSPSTSRPPSRELRIGPVLVGADHPPFVIAELSANHLRSLPRALAIIDAAAELFLTD